MEAPNRNNDTGAKNRWRSNVSDGLRESAKARACPSCLRRGAIKRTVEADFVLRVCRYCDFEEGRYLPLPPSTRREGE
jgi:ribosomal protein L37AE/L43A